jgi:hypothetical protein
MRSFVSLLFTENCHAKLRSGRSELVVQVRETRNADKALLGKPEE